MPNAKSTLMSWSSGKDSAWALHTLQQDPNIHLVGIFCVVNEQFDRVAMHAVKTDLLRMQAQRLKLPLHIIQIPYPCSDAAYESVMRQFVATTKANGVENIAFGDLFLEDIRDYRIRQLAATGITPVFPVWGMPTEKLSRLMLAKGLRAVITCVDPKQIPREFVGREYDAQFLDDLPEGVDPCGENGEFHSFVFDGPMFDSSIDLAVGEVVERDGFVFADIQGK